jgi:hypothetical protein
VTARATRSLWFALAAVLIGCYASAQPAPGWTVQVVALRDFREAQAAVTELKVLEFDAYTEFSMLEGQQYVRVRTGCFTTRDGAEALATVMRGRVTAEAEAVEITPGAPVRGCVEEDVGFLNSYDWELMSRSTGVPSFRVTISGVIARLVHDGRRWTVLQGDGEPQAERASDAATARIVQRRVGGTPFAALDSLPGPVLLCPGTLVTTVADVAIVERTDVIVACRMLVPGIEEASR